MAMRISCATPVLGPLCGLVGVGVASALAGQTALHLRHALLPPGEARAAARLPPPWRVDGMLVDAALGVALFKGMGGRFRSVMPSDLTRVGAVAVESMPTRGIEYASAGKRRELLRFFRRDGCHHCGTRRGEVIGDHMPPNKVALEAAQRTPALLRPLANLRWARRGADALGIPVGRVAQRYYPQVREGVRMRVCIVC